MRGGSGLDNRLFVDAIVWMADNTSYWLDLPEAFGKRTAALACSRRWSHVWCTGRVFPCSADTPDLESVLIDSRMSKVHATRGAQKGLKLPLTIVRVTDR
jgi:putative transposase